MSQNLLEHAKQNRAIMKLKEAFRAIGCDCDFDDIDGAADAVKNLSTVPTVVNAALMPGPGVKVTPIARKGYKLSATDEAQISSDINNKYRKGTAVHDVLAGILHHDLPKAVKMAIRAPRVADMEVFKVHEDGVDYYNNPYFGVRGQGRKTGLHPCDWYVKIYTTSQIEPLYLSLAPMVADLKEDILIETRRECDKAIAKALHKFVCEHPDEVKPFQPCIEGHHHHCNCLPELDPDFTYHPERPSKPGKPHRPVRPEPEPEEPIDPVPGDEDDEFVVYEQPLDPNTPPIHEHEGTGCPLCDEDDSFGGFGDDDDFDFNPNDLNEDDKIANFLNSLDDDE